MEESEKRKERLKAMRMEASQVDLNSGVENYKDSLVLSNPLIETSTVPQESHASQRFDYYTDPMSAFSGNKKSKVSQITSHEDFTPQRQQSTVMTPLPALPSQINYSGEQTHQPQEPVGSPNGMTLPLGVRPRTPCGSWNRPAHSNSPRGGNFSNIGSPGFVQGVIPRVNSGQGRSHWYGNSPVPESGDGGAPGFGQEGGPGFSSEQGQGYWSNNIQNPGSGYGGSPGFVQGSRPSYNSGHGRGYWSNNSPNPSYGRGGSPSFRQGGIPNFNSGQGRGSWFGNSLIPNSGCQVFPSPNSGRGSSQRVDNSASPGSGWIPGRGRGGRGRGFQDNVSAELRPDLYYNKSMVEDPWRFLKPVLWKIEDSPPIKSSESVKSWLPKSISGQRAKTAEASRESNSSQPSLAEYLAASLSEAVRNDNVNDESSV